jgi:hypothetical protein
MGLSQPLDERQLDEEREAGKSYSSYGFELGFVVPDHCEWPTDALYGFITHITDGVELGWGHRFAFGFAERPSGDLGVFTGHPEDVGASPIGEIRAVVFWRYLFPDWEFLTSTGKFMILIATGITEREWEAAKETISAHVMLLLCRSGVGQRTLVNRKCLLDNPKWEAEWREIKTLHPEECMREIDDGVGRWHLDMPEDP